MPEPRERRPQDRNTIRVSTRYNDQELRNVRQETENIRLELDKNIESVKESLPDLAPQLDLSQVGGATVLGTVTAFDPVTQQALVAVSGGGIVQMANFATFQLVPNDIVACLPLPSNQGFVIVGLVRQPDYIPPSWAIPIVTADFPLQVNTLLYPMASGASSFVIDDSNELGFGAGSIVAAAQGASPAVVVLTPGASSIISLTITSSQATSRGGDAAGPIAIFGGRIFAVATSSAASSRYSVHIWDPATGWTEDTLTGPSSTSNITPSLFKGRLTEYMGRLYYSVNSGSVSFSGSVQVSGPMLAYIEPFDAAFTQIAAQAGSSLIGGQRQVLVRDGHVWWSQPGATGEPLRYNPLSSFSSFGSSELTITRPSQVTVNTSDISEDGTLWNVFSSSGDLGLVAVTNTGVVQAWPSVFDPNDRPESSAPSIAYRPFGGLYVPGVYRYINSGLEDIREPAIWSIDPFATQDNTTRVWTGAVHGVLVGAGAVSASVRFSDVNTAQWTVDSAGNRFYYRAVL
jgi:hypothetical protein